MCRATNPPIHGRSRCPATNGNSNCSAIVFTDPHAMPPPALAAGCMATCTSSGVATIPIRLDSDALHTAAATLPRAIAVNAIDDCTVDGSNVRNNSPDAITGSIAAPPACNTASPTSGNRI